MPKKKKTRKQKELADVRRRTEPAAQVQALVIEKKQQFTEERSSVQVSPSDSPKKSQSYSTIHEDYKYLGKDLRKTILLTAVIIGLELVLKFGTGL